MKRITLIMTLMLALLAEGAALAGSWQKTIAAAQKAAKEKNQLILVDLFAEWCGWCHRMEQEVFPSEKFQTVTKDMVLLKVDTEDQGEGTRLSRDVGVQSLPTFLILTADLMIAGKITGYQQAPEFAKSIAASQAQFQEFLKFSKSDAKTPSDYQLRLNIAKAFVERRGFAAAEGKLTKLLTEKQLPEKIRDEAYFQLATSQFKQKKHEASKKTMNRFMSIQKKGEPLERTHLLMGEVYLDQNNVKGALEQFRSFKKVFPNSPLVENVNYILPRLEQAAGSKQ